MTPSDLERIAANPDPVLRNLQITQAYFELSRSTARFTGTAANWCTFATWASKQAGQTIRGEDLRRGIEQMLEESAELRLALETLSRLRREVGAGPADPTGLHRVLLRELSAGRVLRRTSESVAAGNRKVAMEPGSWQVVRSDARLRGERCHIRGAADVRVRGSGSNSSPA